MTELDRDITAFDGMRSELETKYPGKWALIRERHLVATFETFEEAANEAVKRFHRGPFMIRQVGAPPVVLPASVMYMFQNAGD